MNYYDYFMLAWVAFVTGWIMFFPMKEGRQGERGEQGRIGKPSQWEMDNAMNARLDDAEYMTKLIQKINSYQLHGGNKINESDV